MQMIKWPDIESLRHVVAEVNRNYNFIGLDENENPIYDISKPKPIISFTGTVKLHGTNAQLVYDNGVVYATSRERVLDIVKDNAGFCSYTEKNKNKFLDVFKQAIEKYNIDTSLYKIVLAGEWAGTGINKIVAITELPKSWYIFGLYTVDSELKRVYYPINWISDKDINLYNMAMFPTYTIDIDFNVPDLSNNKIVDLTIEVENECPVAKYFGVSGIGEGIVFSGQYEGRNYKFKSKGEKHAGKSKVKVVKKIDDAKIQKLLDLADSLTPEWRLEQMLTNTFDLNNGGCLDVKRLGDYIKSVMNDIVKEETDIIVQNDVSPHDLGKYVAEISKKYFFVKWNELKGA